MDQSGREDPKLSEVKAVLHRLQGLPADSQSAEFLAAEANPRGRRWMALAGIVIVAAAAILAVLIALPNVRELATSAPKGAPEMAAPKEVATAGPNSTSIAKAGPAAQAAKQASTKAALETAAALMNSGRIQAARRQLLAVATDGSPDVALALARTYDPNVLAQILAPDAPPDVAEAARWYRAWHAAAVKQGMSLDRMSLERLIGSMQR
jgi:hypothetical protein